MRKKILFTLATCALVFSICAPSTGLAEAPTPPEAAIHSSALPENTVFLAAEQEARFSQDFSPLLNQARLSWIILDRPAVPDSIKDQNIILLGSPDSGFSGEIIQDLLAPAEIASLQTGAERGVVLEIENPWQEDRTILICSGESSTAIRDAVERVLHSLIDSAPPASNWIRTTYEAPWDDNLKGFLELLQYDWEEEELTVQNLTMDVDAKPQNGITTEEAAQDVERLFYLFSHGYSGYVFFNQEGQFDQAKARILEELSSKSTWSHRAFSNLLHEHLQFIADCHLTIGEHRFSNHSDFWYDTSYELSLDEDGYRLISKGTAYQVQSINGSDPDPYLFPSLNQDGDPIYRLGVLSADKPSSLQVVGTDGEEEHSFKVNLKKSNFEYYAEQIFREDLLGGIPVIRARSFGDYYRDTLSEFSITGAAYRNAPVVIVDIRGNGGGNERWPISWIQYLTGRRAESIFIFSELESKTSMMGRANAFDYWIQTAGINTYRSDLNKHISIAESIESGSRQAGWRGPIYPSLPLIPNDTTVIVITNDLVASAGEGFVLRASQLENVLVVGENTMGCLTFGNISAHKLPHSNLMIWMPINFGLFPDQEIREGLGLAPHLWVPAADAVNYTVAALRKGTISTALPLPGETLEAEFKPESSWKRILDIALENWFVILFFCAAGTVWAYFFRQKTRILLAVGAAWCILAGYWLLTTRGEAVHYSMLAVGAISLLVGLYRLWETNRTQPGNNSPLP